MALFGRRHVAATVTALAWSREVVVASQHWVAVRSFRPPGDQVRNLKKHTGIYAAPVPQGRPGPPADGAFPGPAAGSSPTELRPRIYYTYEEVHWGAGRVLTAAGTSQADVSWPDENLAAGKAVRSRHESYTATFAADGKQYEASLPEQEWRVLEKGLSCRLTLGLRGTVKDVSPGQ